MKKHSSETSLLVSFPALSTVAGTVMLAAVAVFFSFQRTALVLGSMIAAGEIIYLATWKRAIPPHAWRETARVSCVSLIFIAATTFGLMKWWNFTIAGQTEQIDLTQDYLAAHALRAGEMLYGATIWGRSFGFFSFPIAENFHPPSNAILFVPLSYVSFGHALLIWNLLSLVAYIGSIVLLLRLYGLVTFWGVHLSALLLLWEPFAGSIGLGQVSVILTFLLIAGLACLKSGSARWAGGAFAIATLIKLFPGFLFLYLIVKRKWQSVGAFLIVLLSGVLITWLVAGADNVIFYINEIIPRHVETFTDFPLNVSFEGVVRTLLEPTEYSAPAVTGLQHHVRLVGQLVNGSFLIFTLITGWRYRNIAAADDLFALFCISMLLLSPITWEHSCLIILVPLTILLCDGYRKSQPGLILAGVAVFLLFQIPHTSLANYLIGVYSPVRMPWYVALCAKPGFFGLVILWFAFYRKSTEHALTSLTTASSCGLRDLEFPSAQA